MGSQTRILIITDNDDAPPLLRELRASSLHPELRHVETITGVNEALKDGPWDIVLSDYNLPQQSFAEIMQTIRAVDAEVPVIVVSGSIGEENAVALMQEGLADFLHKGSLSRLIPAIERELTAAAARIARRESEQRFRDIVEVSGDWVWETDKQHRFTFFSNRFEEAEWADPATSLGKTPWELANADLEKDEHWQAHLSDREAHRAFRNFLFSFVSDSGSRYHISMSGVPVFDRAGTFKGYRGTATDQTPVVAAFWRAEEAEALLGDAVDSISEGFIIFDADDRIVMANEAFRKLYADVSDMAVPGVTFEDFIRVAVERGMFPDAKGRETEWISDRLDSHRGLAGGLVQRLADGRWVLVTERRMSNGGIAGLRMDISALKRAEAQRDHLAEHDAITGLPNKATFTDRLQRTIGQFEHSGGAIAVVCMELTSLHDIRDSRGFDAGDVAIQEVADRLRDAIAPGEILSHIGAGQFLVLLTGLADDAAAKRSVEALLAPFTRVFRIDGSEVPFRVAVGVCTGAGNEDAGAVIRNATTAMRRAKRMPAERYCFYDAEMTDAAVSRAALEADLGHAIERDELFLLFQPQINTHDYKLVGAEALVRWQHPTRGLIGPSEFIPVAEESGLIVPIGEHVIRLACRQARAWRDRGTPIPVSINLSAVQLADRNLGRTILSIVREAGLPPDAITLELTESAILRDAAAAAHTMKGLAAEGMHFALDDFGMEHSALSHLSDLPFDVLKIDRAFVMRMIESRGHAALLQAIVAMIHSLGMTAVAEGVEEASQLLYLQAYGCDMLQGFLFARPMPPEELEAILDAGMVTPSIRAGDLPKMEELLHTQSTAA